MSSADIGFIKIQQLLLSSQDSIYSPYAYKDFIVEPYEEEIQVLPHTADIAFVAYGKTFGEAIENAALAMFCVMFDAKKLERLDAKERRFRITESAKSREDLVWFTLQNILSRIQVGNLSPTRFHVSSLKEKAGTFSAEGTLVCNS